MTRFSAGSLRKGYHLRDEPTPGTRTYKLYRLFTDNPLKVFRSSELVQITGARYPGATIDALNIYYGLDIRKHSHHHWWLVGKDQGAEYIDYLKEHPNPHELLKTKTPAPTKPAWGKSKPLLDWFINNPGKMLHVSEIYAMFGVNFPSPVISYLKKRHHLNIRSYRGLYWLEEER
jgi:hypothetical protein